MTRLRFIYPLVLLVFALVIMALVTTGLTGPLLSLGDWLRTRRALVARPA